ncbi:MAG: aspartyl-phosphate phosphatase Spo0E family protein [Tissierellia bacterium]|nr:aspartyl-phosphate phosphatase Spo0E family protein [Tissierellia bacterium]
MDRDLMLLEKEIDSQKEKLNRLVVKGLDNEDTLKLSCQLDKLINEYYKILLYGKVKSS